MNKKLFFTAMAITLLAASCGKKAATQPQSNQQAKSEQSASSTEGSFKQIMASGKPQQCDITYQQGENQSQGTMYVVKDRMRGDFTAQVSGQTVKNHIIVDNKTFYSWNDGATTGFKGEQNQSSQSQSNPHAFNTDQNVKANCRPWSEDSSVFSPPVSITFTDIGSIQTNPGTSTSSKPSMSKSQKDAACASCNNAGPNKDQCRKVLACE